MNRDAAIGNYLQALRERASMKQAELAKKLEWSAAVLSRVESGERPLTEDELDIILRGIGTPEAERLKEILSRRFEMLPEPALDDPDSDLLWQAEQTAVKVHALAEQPDVRQFFERRLLRYKEELRAAAGEVLDKRYRVAFIGTIAVGKSTSICRVEGLESPNSTGALPTTVLETGGGGITICDVHVRRGPDYGLMVEPCSEDEIRAHVMDFAQSLLSPPGEGDDDEANAGSSPGISREVDRAVRSMTGLRRRRSQSKPDGSVTPASDDARDLAATFFDARVLGVEILARMELHKRDRRDIWYDPTEGKEPLVWMQEMFEKINNGRHPEFTLPKRIEVVVPQAILGQEEVSVTLIDSRGIDDLAARADLEQHFDDSHTIVMLCTPFPQAPSTEVRQLLSRAKEAGVRTLENRGALLVLARAGEALAVKFEGIPAQSKEEGYEIKGDEIRLKLHPLGLDHLPLTFFNAAEDHPQMLREFIASRIDSIRSSHRAALKEIVDGANDLLANYEKQQAQEIIRDASRRLTIWLTENAEIPRSSPRPVHDSLIAATRAAHWKTISASINRKGGWPNLNYAHQLSHGARRIATQLIEPKIAAFKILADSIMKDEELVEAHDLARQALRTIGDGFDDLIRNTQLVGESIYVDDMREDVNFWKEVSSIGGIGYRDRVNTSNNKWFVTQRGGQDEKRVMELVSQKWTDIAKAIRALLPED